jgi:TRAP-type mannitol/chloroaromatic compound transport system substrate-binding protein
VVKNYYWPGWHEPGTTGEVMINLKLWESLPSDQKAMLQAVIQAEAWRENSEYTTNNSAALKTLVDKHGVQLRRFPDELLNQIGAVAGEVVAEIGNSDPLTKKVYDSFLSFRELAIAWTKISEQTYLVARSLPFKYG